MAAEAERLHQALEASFERFYEHLDGSRFERRPGYVFLTCPAGAAPAVQRRLGE